MMRRERMSATDRLDAARRWGSASRSPSVVALSASKKAKVSTGDKLMVGAVSGVVGVMLTYPLDYTKTQLQRVGKPGMPSYTGPVDVAQKTFSAHGFRGFYRGISANLIGVSPEKAIKLSVNDIMRDTLEDDSGNLSLAGECLAGSTAGFVQVIATNPMEIVKIRLQSQDSLPEKERLSARQIVERLGWNGMYRGTVSTLLRDVPFSFIFFPLYAQLRNRFSPPDQPPSIMGTLSAGILSGAFSAGLVTPLDVIKTRLQEKGGKTKYGNWAGAARALWAEGGIATLYSGATVRAMTIAPLFGIALVAFEMQKHYLLTRNNGKDEL